MSILSRLDRSTPLMKIFGERNTGTNFLTYLVKRNLEAELLHHEAKQIPISSLQKMHSDGRLEHLDLIEKQRIVDGTIPTESKLDINAEMRFHVHLGWKHSLVHVDQIEKYVDEGERRVIFLTLTKNPYSWLLSLFRRPYNRMGPASKTFEEFLTSPWGTVGRENAPAGFADPIDMWNAKNRAYIELSKRLPVVNLRYEDLVADPGAVIRLIADAFSLRWKRDEFRNIEDSTKGDKMNFDDYRTYYLEEKWRRKLTARHIETINWALDESVLRYYGYELIDRTDLATRS